MASYVVRKVAEYRESIRLLRTHSSLVECAESSNNVISHPHHNMFGEVLLTYEGLLQCVITEQKLAALHLYIENAFAMCIYIIGTHELCTLRFLRRRTIYRSYCEIQVAISIHLLRIYKIVDRNVCRELFKHTHTHYKYFQSI